MQQPMHGVGASAAKIHQVLAVFAHAHAALTHADSQWREDCLLPVSDAKLRELCGVAEGGIPPPVDTLMLGAPPPPACHG
jgi:hypothetical protein